MTLRPIIASDADAMWDMIQDEEGNDLTATQAVFTYDQIAEWCATRAGQNDRLDLAIIETNTGEFAGEVVLNEYEPASASASFRISLRGPAWFGRGLGTEATTLIVHHAFSGIGLMRVTLEVLSRNPRARRSYEKAGFSVVREFEESDENWIEMAITRPGVETHR